MMPSPNETRKFSSEYYVFLLLFLINFIFPLQNQNKKIAEKFKLFSFLKKV